MSSTKQPNTVPDSSHSGEPIELHPAVKDTLEEIDAALARAAEQEDGPTITSAVYRAEPDLDLFIFTISNERRLVIPREYLQPVYNATSEQAADMDLGEFRDTVWWTQVDEGLTLEGLLAGRYGNKHWMARLHPQLASPPSEPLKT